MKFLSFYGLYCANIVCLCIVNGSTPIKNITKTDGVCVPPEPDTVRAPTRRLSQGFTAKRMMTDESLSRRLTRVAVSDERGNI